MLNSKSKLLRLLILAFVIILQGNFRNLISQNNIIVEDHIEKYLETLEGNDEIDLTELREKFESLIENPVNLNTCDYEELNDIGFLSDLQLKSFFDYRFQFGEIYSVYELQAVPALDLKTIELLMPFITVGSEESRYRMNILSMVKDSKKDLILKTKTIIEDRTGYQSGEGTEPKYAGDKMAYYSKLRIKFENRLSIGLIAEKDPGELFFKGYNKQGFDYYSAHAFIYKPNKWIKELNIGDYTVSFGQGLILHNDFGRGKSAIVNNIKKNASKVIKPYSSVNENMYFRGVGFTVSPVKDLEISLFGSAKKSDASIDAPEIDYEEEEIYVSSLQISGFHRTESEIEGKHSITELSTGSRINYRFRNGYAGANFYLLSLSNSLQRDDNLTDKFRFSGDKLINLSIDYSKLWKNILFFGELARSKNNAYAFIQGVQFVPGSKIDISLLYRNYSKSYESVNSNSFGETIGTNNEEGLYAGINFKINRFWTLSYYQDIWNFDWLRYSIGAPSSGKEFFGILKYTLRHKFNFYVQFKNENKANNLSEANYFTKITENGTKNRLRFHFDINLNKNWELRNRVEFSDFQNSEKHSKGFLVYQDIIFRPLAFPIDFSMRYAVFDATDYEAGIYAYENDLIGESYIPVYYKKGFRTYINIKYQPNPAIRAELRWGRWYYPYEKSIGSGNELINSNHKTELKLQLKLNF